jgi:inosine/xanthosine triphosphatase
MLERLMPRDVIVAIGSKNPAKTRGTKDAFSLFFRKVEVREVDVSGLVMSQPMSLDETLAGARKRAMTALGSGKVDFGVGVEAGIVDLGRGGGVGVEKVAESLNLQLAAVADPMGRVHFGCSAGFPLPPQLIATMIESGKELDAYAHELTGTKKIREEDGIIYHLSMKNLSRVQMTEQCVSMALLPWVNDKIYGMRG